MLQLSVLVLQLPAEATLSMELFPELLGVNLQLLPAQLLKSWLRVAFVRSHWSPVFSAVPDCVRFGAR